MTLAKPSSSPDGLRIGIDDDMRPEARAVLAHAPALGLELAGARGRLRAPSPERPLWMSSSV